MNPDDIRLTVTTTPLDAGAVLVTVAGEIDGHTAAEFYVAVRTQIDSAVHVVLDLSGVAFIDSAGLRALIDCNRAVRVGSRLSMVQVPERIRRLFEMTTLDRVFRLYGTAEEAMSAE